ncbi:WXG100-like domain-containing protein [Rhodococcoides corynebacterioides]|uniref:Outer membrane channel protein CpnT-like N-terminal domain-containing protein n=1 Tax=Rhodococcoides corynebacterioides TaxID=53972 RepID=A0ABS7P2J1_9NOCA|nr:hypothetical protein [Rhodococcus corynebacterioides]MBY6366608.1 hypothetical protein [Rhodococcus corynebacterioides]MBY6408671.1 hypothetical protein [Rhodococcus corynebacterioides]
MAPIVVDLAPDALTAAARALYGEADTVATAVRAQQRRAADWGGMAGSDEAGRRWGTAYDEDVAAVSGALRTVVSALSSLGVLIEQSAVNHATADSIAASGPPPDLSAGTPTTLEDVLLPSAVGDSGPGLQGAIEIADAVGVPCPNGDTDRLRAASEAWIVVGRELLDVRSRLLGVADGLRVSTSPEIDAMQDDVRRVLNAVEAAAGACSGLAALCRDFADRLADTRAQIRDLIEQFAIEEAAAVAVGIGLAFVSAGLSAAAGAAVAAGRFARTASRVRAVVAALGAFARMRRNETAMATLDRVVDDVEEVTTRVPVRWDDVVPRDAPPAAPGWSSSRALDDHFARHGADVGARSAQDYAELAARFRDDPSHLVKVGPDGTVRMYDPASNTFAAYAPDGTVKTLFRPGSGAAYWDRQPGVPR